MAIREGYKQTEVGLIPKDWDVRNLGDVVYFWDGQRKPLKSSDRARMRGEYPYYGASGIIDYVDNYIFDDDLILLGEDGENILSRNCRLAFQISGRTWVNNHAHVLKPKDGYNIIYLTEYLESINYDVFNTGTAQPKLNKRTCYSIPIISPSLAEQIAIANALSDVDALIQSLEKLIAKKRLIKQGAMQELLKPKAGWVTRRLGEIGEISGSGVDKKSNPNEIPVRLLNYLDVFHRDFIYSNELNHYVTAPLSKAKRCAIKKGDIFFTPSSEMRFDIAISAVAMEDIPDATYSYHLDRLRLFENWNLAFRTYIFKTKYFLDQAEKICEGSGKRYVISLSKFRNMVVCYPPDISEQAHIANILSDMDSEIKTLKKKAAKYRFIKQGMMQELLTGRTRLI